MNNTYKTNKTDWRRLGRSILFVALLLGASLPAMAADYVFLYNSGGTFHILSNTSNTITDVTTFSYTNCVWSGNSGGTFSNQGRYLYWTNNNSVWTANTSGDNLTINGNKIYNTYRGSNYYIRYNSNQWVSSTTNSQNEVVYLMSTQSDQSLSTPTIASDDFVFTDLTSHRYSASATYSYKLYKLAGANTYYVVEGGTPSSSTTVPTTTDGITYVWSLADGTTDNGHVRINPSTGDVTYYNAYTDANHTVGIKVTATHSASGLSQTSSTKNITVNKLTAVNPTGITATDITVSQGNTITATNYTTTATLSAGQYPYSHVTATSGATDIATVANVGDGFTITGVAVGSATITIKAYNIGNSVVACSTTFTVTVTEPETGISGSIVILNDYEDHSWAYYSDENCPVHRLNPADIKITYRGYGTKTMTSSNTDQLPANDKFTENVANTAVKVNKNEEGHTFVYYKTLENVNEDGSGNYPYTMIPNPFQVRPTYNSDWRGFYAWRVKSLSSGLSIKVGSTTYDADDISNGIIIYAEQEVEFITANEYGDSVAFEALWAKAYLDDGTNHYSNSGNYRNAYERNFKKVTSLTTYDYPVTISSINPDGSGTVGTVSGPYRSNYTCTQDVKLENMTLGMGNYYIDGNSYNLAIGRGVANGNNNVASAVYGDYSGSSVRSNFTLRIEGGRYSNVRVFYNGSRVNCADAFTGHVYLGSDYDRANNETNNNLVVSSRVGLSQELAFTNAASITEVFVMSGTFGTNTADVEFYMGYQNASSGSSQAKRSIRIYGGDFLGGLAGGIEGGSLNANTVYLTMRISGGTIHRYLYGSGQFSPAYGSRRTIITGGTFDSWVSGGCYGTNNEEGNTEGNTYLYFGGRANQTNTEGIFGAGYGNYTTGDDKYTVYKSNVVFADEATTAGSVYGGGNNGYAKQDIQVYVAGGHVAGNVFGGANKAPSSQDVAVVVTGGSVDGGVYGGSNQSGAISGQITVDIYGTDPQPGSGYAIHQVFGGGNVAAYTGTPVVTVHNDSSCNISIEEVYGGGNQASVIGTNVTIEAGNIIGDVYGGGRQANVGNDGTSVTVNGGIIRRVFGGNNISGTIAGGTAGKITVSVDKTSSCPMKIGQVFGGGNRAASQVGSITVGCTGDLVTPLADGQRYGYDQEGIGAVYGGANNAAINGNITLNIVSGIVDSVFGGNNAGGAIDGDITVNINKNGSAPCANHWYVGYVFGGGNNAAYSQKTADHPAVNVQAGLVTNHVFGGGNGSGATVTGNPTVTLSGTAQVGGNVFGGGNAAAVIGNTSVKLQN